MSVKRAIEEQFNRCAGHYLQDSPMADREVLDLIMGLARPEKGHLTLDVACGAGFLVCALAEKVQRALGVDLSREMLARARQLAAEQGLGNAGFELCDGEALRFADGSFDLVTCKLALHYFPSPARAIAEMKRVAKAGGRLVLVDRVAAENAQQRAYHNRIEKLRTPAKVKVYACSEIEAFLADAGLDLLQVECYEQHQGADQWLRTTGAPPENLRRARAGLEAAVTEDLIGLPLWYENDELKMTHRSAIFVAAIPS